MKDTTMSNADTVDLRSDTITRPTPEMREVMAAAEVGDDVFGEDPTVNRLQQRVAELLGKEAALFVPSGTMANLVAIVAQTRPGESIVISEEAHPYLYEGANIAVVGSLLTRAVKCQLGILSAADVEANLVLSPDHHVSPTTLIAVENTTNRGAGNIYPIQVLRDIADLARKNNMKLHCDGARIFNAVVETGEPVSAYAEHCDTLSFCFSKGLGAPVGSIVVGTAHDIDRMHRIRKMLGGGMRQAGILAAAAIHALDNHVERLKEDHRRNAQFRQALENSTSIEFPMPTPTNIAMMDVPDAADFVTKLAARDIMMIPMGPKRVRAVFHLDIDDRALETAIQACKQIA